MNHDIIDHDVGSIVDAVSGLGLEDSKILLAGGAGFLGSWLSDVLVRSGAMVTCVDNLSTGDSRYVSRLEGTGLFRLIRSDICSFEWKGDEKFSHILHLASIASTDHFTSHPTEALVANSVGSITALELAKRHGATILYTSTSEVYGDPNTVPTPETYRGSIDPLSPRSCYDEGKRFGEALLMAYHRQYGVDTRIVRVFNTYGPRLRADGPYARAITRFIRQALGNQDITVYGDGKQTRSFCYVSDTIIGILLALTNRKLKGDVVNLGNPTEVTILELASRIKRMTGSSSAITFHDLPQDDPRRRRPDIAKAKELLGWQPHVDLREGLSKTILWFKQNASEAGLRVTTPEQQPLA